MKRLVVILLLAAAIVLGLRAFRTLPADNAAKVRVKYETWAGVIRVWVCEDWQVGTGSIVRWLNACADKFEKSHDGVYVNVQTVTPDAIQNFLTTGVNPPDILIYPPGMLASADGLRALLIEAGIRPGLDQIGTYEDARYAVPILMDAHMWIYDAGAYKALPPDLYEVAAACRESDLPALVALNSGLRQEEGEARVLPGVDIGLPGGPHATPEPVGSVPCRVGPDFVIAEDARELFSKRKVSAVIADLNDLPRITAKYEWLVAVTGTAVYADDIALCSIVARSDASADARAALSEQLIGVILTDGQTLTAKAGALPTVDGVAAFSGDILLAGIEAAIEGKRVVTPPAFGAFDPSPFGRAYAEGRMTADEALREIEER